MRKALFEDGPEMDIHRGRVDLLAKRLDEKPDWVSSFSTFRAGKEYGGLYGGCPLRNPTLLHICAAFNAVAAAKLLLERGADVNARAKPDGDGAGNETPIFHAVTSNFNGSFEMLNLLLAHGADVSVRATVRVPTRGGATPRADDVVLKDVTPWAYVHAYPNTYHPGPGSGAKTELDKRPHDQVLALLKTHGAQV